MALLTKNSLFEAFNMDPQSEEWKIWCRLDKYWRHRNRKEVEGLSTDGIKKTLARAQPSDRGRAGAYLAGEELLKEFEKAKDEKKKRKRFLLKVILGVICLFVVFALFRNEIDFKKTMIKVLDRFGIVALKDSSKENNEHRILRSTVFTPEDFNFIVERPPFVNEDIQKDYWKYRDSLAKHIENQTVGLAEMYHDETLDSKVVSFDDSTFEGIEFSIVLDSDVKYLIIRETVRASHPQKNQTTILRVLYYRTLSSSGITERSSGYDSIKLKPILVPAGHTNFLINEEKIELRQFMSNKSKFSAGDEIRILYVSDGPSATLSGDWLLSKIEVLQVG